MGKKFMFGGKEYDLDATLIDLERNKCEEDLYEFMVAAWKYIDPNPFVHGWPLEAVSEALMAVADGDIRRLLVNIPPRCSKSTLCSVAFPAWVWAQRKKSATCGPGVQFLTASFAQQLSLRDSVKTRRLLDSSWYKERWGDRFMLTSDQNTKGRYDNDQGGSRLATSVGSALTGEGGNIIIVDDPNAAQEAFSEATIATTIDWWDSALSTRLNDAKRGAFIIIQQRLAENDLTGHILEKQVGDWHHLCLPMKYEWERHSYLVTGWQDPRGLDDEGEPLVYVDESGRRIPRDSAAQKVLTEERQNMLLWPDRFGENEVRLLEQQLGPFAAAGQLQQRPDPADGGVIKKEWWQPWDLDSFPPFDYVIAALDTAYTTKTENDFSALSVWGVFSATVANSPSNYVGRNNERASQSERENIFDEAMRIRNKLETGFGEQSPKVMLIHAWQERLELHELVEKVAKTAKQYKVDKLIVENKAAGHSVAQEIRRLYNSSSFACQLVDPKSQDKLARLYSVQHLFAESMVHAPDRQWADMVIQQVGQFPKGKHDDLVDTVSMALRHLREMGMLTRFAERTEEIEDMKRYIGKSYSQPLYPA